LQSKRESKEKLDPYFQALQRLEGQIFTFREIAAGRLLKLVPQKEAGAAWTPIADLQGPLQQSFLDITKAFVGVIGSVTGETKSEEHDATLKALDVAVSHFEDLARAQAPDVYPSVKDMQIEVHYNNFHPFQKAWILYLLAMLAALISWTMGGNVSVHKRAYQLAWALALGGLV